MLKTPPSLMEHEITGKPFNISVLRPWKCGRKIKDTTTAYLSCVNTGSENKSPEKGKIVIGYWVIWTQLRKEFCYLFVKVMALRKKRVMEMLHLAHENALNKEFQWVLHVVEA